MSDVKVSIIYYSATGANYLMAQAAERAARGDGCEVRVRRVAELADESIRAKNPAWQAHYQRTESIAPATLEDLEWADAMVFSTPTRYGTVASQMKQFIDSTGPLWAAGKLANKAVTAMATAQNAHGGQEATLLSLYTNMFHWGAIVVAPGYTDPVFFQSGGNPYGTSMVAQTEGPLPKDIEAAIAAQTHRVVAVASWIKAGRSVTV